MYFIKNDDWQPGLNALREALVEALSAGKRTLWLVTGGSNIPGSVSIMQTIPPELTENLIVTLTDERYGPVGHDNSNWRQLIEAGFESQHAMLMPVLEGERSLEDMRAYFETKLNTAFDTVDTIIGQYGMGKDGHIAGILPHSPAVEAKGLTAAYQGPDYERITETFDAIRRTHIAYLFAFGDSKKPALEQLKVHGTSLADQPSQILHELPEVYVCNNQIGD